MSRRRTAALAALWVAVTLAAGAIGASIVATISPVAPNFAAGIGFTAGAGVAIDLGHSVHKRRRRSDD